jgi:hypothetical protein
MVVTPRGGAPTSSYQVTTIVIRRHLLLALTAPTCHCTYPLHSTYQALHLAVALLCSFGRAPRMAWLPVRLARPLLEPYP